jgi:hypothetical protein
MRSPFLLLPLLLLPASAMADQTQHQDHQSNRTTGMVGIGLTSLGATGLAGGSILMVYAATTQVCVLGTLAPGGHAGGGCTLVHPELAIPAGAIIGASAVMVTLGVIMMVRGFRDTPKNSAGLLIDTSGVRIAF